MDKQYKARNKEDGQIYYLRPVHHSVPEIYFVFKHPHFSDSSYCGHGYCKHFEILEEYPIGVSKREKPKTEELFHVKQPEKPKAKPVQTKLF